MAKPTPTRSSSGAPRASRSLLLVAGILSGLLSFTSAGVAGYLVWIEVLRDKEKIRVDPRGDSDPVNVIVLGSDTREGLTEAEQAELGSTEDVGGRRSDTLILVHVRKREKAVMVHFPRDLRVAIPGHGEDKINTAFNTGGPQLVVDTVAELTGMPIHHYIEVDFIGFKRLVDDLGGVEICVDRPIVDELSGIRIRKPGCSEFDGIKALKFVRARHVEGDAIPDFARIGRQQQFIRALFNQLLRARSLLSPSIVQSAARSIKTDEDLELMDMWNLAMRLKDLGPTSVDFRVVPGIAGPSFVELDVEKADLLFERLANGRALGRVGSAAAGVAPSPGVIRVLVMDAGATPQARAARGILDRGGFVSIGLEEAPAELRVSEIIFRAGAEDRARVVQGFFPDLEIRQAPKRLLGKADVVVVVAKGP